MVADNWQAVYKYMKRMAEASDLESFVRRQLT